MWVGKSKSHKADIVFGVYAFLIWSIEFFVYDFSHVKQVTGPIWDFILG